jgi:23S rRNA pseudouridine2605 synthase
MATPKKSPKAAPKTSTKKTSATKKPAKSKKIAVPEPEIAEAEPAAARAAETPVEAKMSEGVKPRKKPAKSKKAVAAEAQAAVASQLETAEVAEAADDEAEPEFTPEPRPPAKLERLQKILAAAGVASRRSAEAMIEQGRVQLNGKVVTVLGTKADAGRDHIRVDGKLLQGAERLRYFVLNKPRGFVTTVKDPEGRPTVMQFFEKMKERLYPVGRLDYLSEGLLVVTNDGELANRLTKAASGVEKTYLVKVAGQPTEAELDVLRGGVSIALGAPGSRQVRTSPARIRQVRQGDNPWYEVVLIEGRNRELRKMFESVGHFVEKIRRTGYGPLVLDQEPGNLRELQPEELAALRLAADGKLRTPKSKDLRRRNLLDAGLLPTVLPKPSSRARTAIPMAQPPAALRDSARSGVYKAKKFGDDRPARPTRPADRFASGDANKFFRQSRPGAEDFRPAAGRTSAPNPVRSFSRNEAERPPRNDSRAAANFGFARPAGRSFDGQDSRPNSRPDARSGARPSPRPAWKKDDRPRTGAPRSGSAATRPARPFIAKPAWKKPERAAATGSDATPTRSDRPSRPTGSARPERFAKPTFQRPAPPRREAPARVFDEDLGPVRPPNLHIEEITGPDRSSFDRSSTTRPPARSSAPRSSYSRPSAPRPYADRPKARFDRPATSDRPSSFRPRPERADRPGGDRPSFARSAGARPSFTSSGKPRSGGARPSGKPGKPSTFRPERKSGTGWKPKPSFSSGKPAFKGMPGGKRPAGKPAGRKRG